MAERDDPPPAYSEIDPLVPQTPAVSPSHTPESGWMPPASCSMPGIHGNYGNSFVPNQPGTHRGWGNFESVQRGPYQPGVPGIYPVINNNGWLCDSMGNVVGRATDLWEEKVKKFGCKHNCIDCKNCDFPRKVEISPQVQEKSKKATKKKLSIKSSGAPSDELIL